MVNRFKSLLAKTLVVCLVSIFLIPLCLWSGKFLIVNDFHLPKSDVIIVLGYPARNDGRPSPIMKSRVEKAVELFDENYAPIVIFSGASVRNEFVEAEIMASYAESLGMPKHAIRVETESRDTVQNVRHSAELMHENDWHVAIIVTSPYHTRRAFQLFSKLDIEVSVVAAEHPPELKWYDHLEAIVHEYALMLWYKIVGEGLDG